MVKIFLNGYGNIGRRLATAFSKDKSIELVGIAKYSPDEETEKAINKGYKVFVPKDLEKGFQNKNYKISGTVEDAVRQADIVIDAAKEGKVDGWGIGLPYVRSVAESHGGSIAVDSSVNRGTTFTMDIPADASSYLDNPTLGRKPS